MKYYFEVGYILYRRSLGESDIIFSFFSLEKGRISFVAKGIKKSSAKLSGQMQPFALIKIRLVKGKNLDILIGAEVLKHTDLLKTSMPAVATGYRMLEMLQRCLAEHQQSKPAFGLFETCLESLQAGIEPSLVSQYFAVRLLDSLGSQPDFMGVNPTANYYLDYESGQIVSDRPSAHYGIVPERVIKLWRLILHNDLAKLSSINGISEILDSANSLIEKHYEYHYNVQFKSKNIE